MPNSASNLRPTSQAELGRRLSAVLRLLGTRQKASEIAGRSTDQLIKYERGITEPPFSAIAALCEAAGVRMEWLATGEGEMRVDAAQTAPRTASQPVRQPDAEMELGLLTMAMRIVDELLNSYGIRARTDTDQYVELVRVTFRDLARGAAEDAARDALNTILSIARNPHHD